MERIVYVCHSEGEWAKQDLSAFERGVVFGARRTSLSVSRTTMLLGVSRSTVSHVYQELSTTKGYAANSRPVVENGSLMKEAKGG